MSDDRALEAGGLEQPAGASTPDAGASGPKGPLEAAASLMRSRFGIDSPCRWQDAPADERQGWEDDAADVVAAYLDHLLGELPEEAVEAAARSLSEDTGMDFATAWNFLHPPNGALGPFLQSLRGSLEAGDGDG